MDEREDFHRWNERFQEALELPEPHDCSATRLKKYEAITSVQRDFLSVASTAARTLISELFLPAERKSVVPRQVGGIAGGRKLELHGILFKLADGRVARGPYQGDDEAAAKALAHELKSADQILKCGIGGVHVALQCRVDFRGFRVLAQARLPIRGSATLVVGSADAGARVRAADDALVQRCGFVAHELGLARHAVEQRGAPVASYDAKGAAAPAAGYGAKYAAAATAPAAGYGANGAAAAAAGYDATDAGAAALRDVELWFAADVEGHRGADGRHYLLDLARVFPPEAPRRAPHLPGAAAAASAGRGNASGSRTIFWRLLRPEFVRHRGALVKALNF